MVNFCSCRDREEASKLPHFMAFPTSGFPKSLSELIPFTQNEINQHASASGKVQNMGTKEGI